MNVNMNCLLTIIVISIPIIVSVISLCNTYKIKKRYKIFSAGTENKNMEYILEKYIGLVDEIKNKNINIEERISQIETLMLNNIQKLGIVRYNALNEMSSNLSFSLALLDGHNTGVVITELYLRNSSSIYIREIKKGICEIDLSQEEKEAIMIAQNINNKKGDIEKC